MSTMPPGPATDETLVLFFHTLWGQPLESGVELPPGCAVTADRGLLDRAAAVVFHVPELRWWTLPRKRPGQLWVAWSMESSANYPRLAAPRFLARFDLTMTYRLDSDVPCGYADYREWVEGTIREGVVLPVAEPDRPIAMFISSHHDRSRRRAYARELAWHIGIDSYGAFMRNRVLDPDEGRASKLEAMTRYPFTLALENSIAEDYVTEKFFDPLRMGSVPVYLGAPNVSRFAPGEDCFIDVRDFAGPAALARHLRGLLAEPSRYQALHAWRERPLRPELARVLVEQREPAFTRLCRAVQRRLAESCHRTA
jgi:hypothetical protein